MRPIEPLPLHHSWPLDALREQLPQVALDGAIARSDAELARRGIGLWRCDLRDDRLSWTAGVYDIFGLERHSAVARPLAVSLYAPDSREAMETLRAYAIRYRRGFTLDVDIQRPDGVSCAMRLITAPLLRDGGVIGLHGVKQLLSIGAPRSRGREPRIFDLL